MLKQTTNRMRNYLWRKQYHARHQKSALKILRSLESAKGKSNPTDIKAAEEYAADVLGWQGYAPWLWVYCVLREEFREGWIPDNYYGAIVLPAINGITGELSEFKTLNNKLFNSHNFPDIAYLINGRYYDPTYSPINKPETRLFSDTEKIVFKLDSSVQGNGIRLLCSSDFETFKQSKPGNGVFQKYINQHEFFEQFNNNAVATLRLTTVLNSQAESILSASYLRIAATTDTHVRSATHIRVPIVKESGQLCSTAYLPDWSDIKKCPGTDALFDQRIPFYAECVNTVTALHREISPVGAIGWDVCVDKDNSIQIMEWNGTHNDIKFSEATMGPCFAGLGWEEFWK